MDVLEAIKTRRSVRKYKSDAVAVQDLEVILEALQWAPSWANTQCWQVIVVTDAAQRRKIQEAFPAGNPGAASLTMAPVVLVLAATKGVSGYYKGQAATRYGDWALFDLGIAMQNVALAARSLGLGTVDMGLFDHAKVEAALGVPDNVMVVAVTPLGYPDDVPAAPKRKSLNDIVSFDRYGQRGR